MSFQLNLPEKDEIRKTYSSYKLIFDSILKNIQNLLERDITLNPKPVIKSRIKSFDSYYAKLLRLKPEEASNTKGLVCLTDMIGFRIVCAFLEDLATVENQLKEKFSVKEVEHKGASQNVKEFGYESTHILIEIPKECINENEIGREVLKHFPIPENLVCEIQVRTILQDAWAEVEHELIYKMAFTPFDAPLRRKLAAVNASLNLADIIFQEIRDYQNKLQTEVFERRSSFYEKADLVTDSYNGTTHTPHSSQNTDIERVSPYVHGTIDDMILQAIHAHNEGDLDGAISIYTKIIESDPNLNENVLAVIYKHRGMAYFAQSKYDLSLSDFNKSASYGKNNFRAVYYAGIVQSVLGNNDAALECFTKSLEMNEFQSHAFYRRALAYYNKGDYEKSLADLNAARKLGLSHEEGEALNEKLISKFEMGM